MSNKPDERKLSSERKKLKIQSTNTPQTLPYGHNRGSALVIPTDYSSMKKKAVKAMFEHAEIQLSPLQEQMAFLKSKKEQILTLPGNTDAANSSSADASLSLINEQQQLIRRQVRSIQEKYLISLEVLKAKFSFIPVCGETYYLYQKGQERILMLVGPHEWSLDENTLYIATVRLMADASWHVLNINESIDIDFLALKTKNQ